MNLRYKHRKFPRNRSLRRYRERFPGISVASLAKIYHISRQRVYVILNHHGAVVPTTPGLFPGETVPKKGELAMPVTTREHWRLWHEERQRFKTRGSTGYLQDILALKTHIMKLQDLAPKDKAGWPVYDALQVIDKLKREYRTYERYLEQMS